MSAVPDDVMAAIEYGDVDRNRAGNYPYGVHLLERHWLALLSHINDLAAQLALVTAERDLALDQLQREDDQS